MEIGIEGPLYDFLKENQDRIDYVALKWMWKPIYVYIETEYVVDGGSQDGYPISGEFIRYNGLMKRREERWSRSWVRMCGR